MKVSDMVRFVLIIDGKGRIAKAQSAKPILLDEEQSVLLGTDMQVLRRMLKLYDDAIGKNTAVHLVREKVHVLIFYVGEWTLLASCERKTEPHNLTDISLQIESLARKALQCSGSRRLN
ncbi:MAG: hypothetical protein KGI33_11255 [Thaumarchaeota archaeon]|nr:hypothetical protein [Nitrososphaerota archaeon]